MPNKFVKTEDGKYINLDHVALVEVYEQLRPERWMVRARMALPQDGYSTFNPLVVVGSFDNELDAQSLAEVLVGWRQS